MEQRFPMVGTHEQALLRDLREAVRTSDLSAKDKNFYTGEIRRVLDGDNHGAMASVIELSRRLGHTRLASLLEGRLVF
jgi:hypothetical protein